MRCVGRVKLGVAAGRNKLLKGKCKAASIRVVVTQQDTVDLREIMEIDRWVGLACASYARPEVDVITGVEEVWLFSRRRLVCVCMRL